MSVRYNPWIIIYQNMTVFIENTNDIQDCLFFTTNTFLFQE